MIQLSDSYPHVVGTKFAGLSGKALCCLGLFLPPGNETTDHGCLEDWLLDATIRRDEKVLHPVLKGEPLGDFVRGGASDLRPLRALVNGVSLNLRDKDVFELRIYPSGTPCGPIPPILAVLYGRSFQRQAKSVNKGRPKNEDRSMVGVQGPFPFAMELVEITEAQFDRARPTGSAPLDMPLNNEWDSPKKKAVPIESKKARERDALYAIKSREPGQDPRLVERDFKRHQREGLRRIVGSGALNPHTPGWRKLEERQT